MTTIVVTHQRPDDRPDDGENLIFVTDGIEAAIAKAKEVAGGKNVVVNGGQMARQAWRRRNRTAAAPDSGPTFSSRWTIRRAAGH